jgi:RHS repeat-associated protein
MEPYLRLIRPTSFSFAALLALVSVTSRALVQARRLGRSARPSPSGLPMRHRWSRATSFVFTVAVLATILAAPPREASAQLAPTGAHYAARESDTGHSAAEPGGEFSASVPLDFPSSRQGLPVPVSIVHGGNRFGAAGLGWDVPISFIRRDLSLAHRRPADSDADPPQPREQVSLNLLGQSLELIPSGNGTTWIARVGSPGVSAFEEAGAWKVQDANGFLYTFETYTELAGMDMWLLRTIAGAGKATVKLTYEMAVQSWDWRPAYEGGEGEGTSIDLRYVEYNPDEAQSFKHRIELVYDAPQAEPQALSVVGSRGLVRMRKLTALEVTARPSSGAEFERIRKYTLGYAADADTEAPVPNNTKTSRLQTVTVSGRPGTPEASVSLSLTVASYRYGSASTPADGFVPQAFHYEKTQTIALPAVVDTSKIASTELVNQGGWYRRTRQNLLDMTGDGRVDLVFPKNNTMWVAQNQPDGNGNSILDIGFFTSQLGDAIMTSPVLEARTSSVARRYPDSPDIDMIDQVWRKVIDVNGDGRLDIIDAQQEVDRWIIYLNMPGPGGPTNVQWGWYPFHTDYLREWLELRGHYLSDLAGVPLERRFTGTGATLEVCYGLDSLTGWHHMSDAPCPDPTPTEITFCGLDPLNFPTHPTWVTYEPQRTYTEWELSDFNGDGYPDLLMNSSPIERKSDVLLNPEDDGNDENFEPCTDYPYANGQRRKRIGPKAPNNAVEVAYNHSASIMDFSPPFTLDASSACGVALMSGGGGTITCPANDCNNPVENLPGVVPQAVVCSIEDVNGDGLADRLEGQEVTLGTGGLFSQATMSAGAPQAYVNPARSACADEAPDATEFLARASGSLRDMTGDGIPDLVSGTTVRVGTGAGFGPPIAITMPPGVEFVLSLEKETCGGNVSETIGGVYDIDGDGRPEMVVLIQGALDVYKLVGSADPRTPEAGRLVQVDNGAGARTDVTYGSAKEDASTLHQVPFPEVVVTAVSTTGTKGLGGDVETRLYAHGEAEQFWDPAADRFRFPGYARSVELQRTAPNSEASWINGLATVTDRHTTPPSPTASPTLEQLLERYLLPGSVKAVTTLSGSFEADPRKLLVANPTTDARTIAATSYVVRAEATQETPLPHPGWSDCLDRWTQYASGFTGMDICRTHGFLRRVSTDSWRGTQAPPSAGHVASRVEVVQVDELGRYTKIYAANDVYRSDDDVCVEMVYATPVANGPRRVLGAMASRYVGFCDGAHDPGGDWLAAEHWEYDELPHGSVSDGLMTAHTVERRDTQNGTLLDSIRELDASHDALGNVVQVLRTRAHDGATHVVSVDYDPFGLAPVRVKEEGTGAAVQQTVYELDPITMDATRVTDPNGVATGSVFDGFGRLRQELTHVSGAKEALSTRKYLGFEGNDPQGRRIEEKTFAEPVLQGTADSAPGVVSTTYLDELGRPRFTVVDMGADYAETIVTGARTYDALGRVVFAADAFPGTATLAPALMDSAYGTTSHFHVDGSASSSVRGYGFQDPTWTTDEAAERYPAWTVREYSGNTENVSVFSPDALLPGSPQFGVVRKATTTAIGRILERSTWQGSNRIELARFKQDALGATVEMTRYRAPATQAEPVTWSWRIDSLGQVTEIHEPDSAPRLNEYSSFGELIVSSTPASVTPPGPPREQIFVHDGLGRLTHKEERTDGQVDTDSVYDYAYDVAMEVQPALKPDYVIGQLARASGPAGDVYLGYGWKGDVTQRVFTDGAVGDVHIERTRHNADGTLASITLQLPDANHDEEVIEYEYDSAGNLQRVVASDAAGSQQLFQRIEADAFGTLLHGAYGATDYEAHYQQGGRRQLEQVALISPYDERRIDLGILDPMDRELSRMEKLAGADSVTVTEYDALGRVAGSLRTNGLQVVSDRGFTYDALGNTVDLHDYIGNDGAQMTYQPADRDKLCRVIYGAGNQGPSCNVVHDEVGNVIEQATRDGYRQMEYHASGAVRSITDQDGTQALFRYDPFGNVQELDIMGAVEDVRRDRRYGEHIERRDAMSGGQAAAFLSRNVPIEGTVASRRGHGGPWVFELGEPRGNRFFVEQDGKFVQDTEYEAFGEASTKGEKPGSAQYTSAQWNQGDALAAFGVSQLGARLYDPVIGRFLSRDPLLLPRTAASTNPYAFAANDPVNSSDPTGLDREGYGPEDTYGLPGLGGALVKGLYDAGHSGPKPPDPWDQGPRDPGTPETPEGKFYKKHYGHLVKVDTWGLKWDTLGAKWKTHEDEFGWSWNLYRQQIVAEEIAWDINQGLERIDVIPWYGYAVQAGFEVATTFVPLGKPAAALARGGRAALGFAGKGLRAGGGVLNGACRGGCKIPGGFCFVAGTLVATEEGEVPIEELRIGQRVEAGNEACAGDHLPQDGVTISLEVASSVREDEADEVELVRSRQWLEQSGLLDGLGYIELGEVGISGWAHVKRIGPPPVEEPGAGCLVVTTMRRTAPEVLALTFEDGTKVEVTPAHPLFLEGHGWVEAGELEVGDFLRTDRSPLRLVEVAQSRSMQRVYNLEIQREHTYRVSGARIWAHNYFAKIYTLLRRAGMRAGTLGDFTQTTVKGLRGPRQGLEQVLNHVDDSARVRAGARELSGRQMRNLTIARVEAYHAIEKAHGAGVAPEWLIPAWLKRR